MCEWGGESFVYLGGIKGKRNVGMKSGSFLFYFIDCFWFKV